MSGYDGLTVDVDIHHRPRHNAELIAYLDQPWKDFATRWAGYANQEGLSGFPLTPPSNRSTPFTMQNMGRVTTAYPDDGTMAGSSYTVLCEQILDPYRIYRGIICHDVGQYSDHVNPEFGQALCQAANRWNVDTWLAIDDDRLHSEIVVPSVLPEEGAKEIRRHASHPKMSGALLAGNSSGRPLGDARNDPIFKATVDAGLCLCVHPSTEDRPTSQVIHVGGNVTSIEEITLWPQQVWHYITSFIVNGTFEKFPDLKVMIKEYGVAWLPFLIWKLDEFYDQLRLESRWVKRWPSEYIHDHIRVSTQPLEESPHDVGATLALLSTVDWLEDVLCFASDHPHATLDYPDYVAKLLKGSWAAKVLCDNACDVYGFPRPQQELDTTATVATHG